MNAWTKENANIHESRHSPILKTQDEATISPWMHNASVCSSHARATQPFQVTPTPHTIARPNMFTTSTAGCHTVISVTFQAAAQCIKLMVLWHGENKEHIWKICLHYHFPDSRQLQQILFTVVFELLAHSTDALNLVNSIAGKIWRCDILQVAPFCRSWCKRTCCVLTHKLLETGLVMNCCI